MNLISLRRTANEAGLGPGAQLYDDILRIGRSQSCNQRDVAPGSQSAKGLLRCIFDDFSTGTELRYSSTGSFRNRPSVQKYKSAPYSRSAESITKKESFDWGLNLSAFSRLK